MRTVVTAMALTLALGLVSVADAAQGEAFLTAKAAGPDFAIQGEYTGTIDVDGEQQKWGIQVIALGDGEFRAVGYEGGLPGDGWNGDEPRRAEGKASEGMVTIETNEATLKIGKRKLTILGSYGEDVGELKKVRRKSSTLGAKPPQGAVVLLRGKTAENFPGGKITKRGLLKPGATSKQKFGSSKCHLEFRLPFMPTARGQGRGNSGCYYQGRYEIQMLDSFGLESKDNECGGIYQVAKPLVNMCHPPLAWQTYDIDLTAAEFQGDKKVKNARITIRHNGVVIHKDLELPGPTPGNLIPESAQPGPIFLQDHGNPVRYRNIWVVNK
jgi:hypothetical protein